MTIKLWYNFLCMILLLDLCLCLKNRRENFSNNENGKVKKFALIPTHKILSEQLA